MTISVAASRGVYWALVALSALGAAALYGQSEGLLRLPSLALARPAFVASGARESHYAPREDLGSSQNLPKILR